MLKVLELNAEKLPCSHATDDTTDRATKTSRHGYTLTAQAIEPQSLLHVLNRMAPNSALLPHGHELHHHIQTVSEACNCISSYLPLYCSVILLLLQLLQCFLRAPSVAWSVRKEYVLVCACVDRIRLGWGIVLRQRILAPGCAAP